MITKQQIFQTAKLTGEEYKQKWHKLMHRDPIIQQAYDHHKEGLKASRIKTEDYIKTVELGLDQYDQDFIRITENRYPYNLARGLKHYVVWYSPRVQDWELLRASVEFCGENNYKFIALLEAPQEQKSVPNLNHKHLFIQI